MKSDKNGISTCAVGQSKHEMFKVGKKTYFEYEYRASDGELFATCEPTLDLCIAKRDDWLAKKFFGEKLANKIRENVK